MTQYLPRLPYSRSNTGYEYTLHICLLGLSQHPAPCRITSRALTIVNPGFAETCYCRPTGNRVYSSCLASADGEFVFRCFGR